jgi:uncharacterized protein DUF6519/parallel beta helix pectate lyase-like protein
MTIDISRKSYDHRRNTVWTTTMQGRVATDAPINEDRQMRDRRNRVLAVDLIGRCGYPPALPTSFEITVAGGAMFIGPGRYHVDGHLAENFGIGTQFFDDVLSEVRFSDPVPFADQPYLPGDPPPAPADGRYLVYLDTWQRDVTFLQDETILDPAVQVDTFARRQSVWQVKAFGPLPDDVDCETPDDEIDGWPAEIAPSGGRLTTRADPAQAPLDPCLLPPGADYRGIDNRTYIYCLHDFAGDGTPLMKFSRSHGVIATTILSQPQADVLEVVEVAKDDFLRFNSGDWVEITDEARMLAETPGLMARVLAVDDPANTITLEDPLPAGTLRLDGAGPDTDQAFNPIIRRWDQSGQIVDTDGHLIVDLDLPGATGLIPVPADGTFIALEDGVEAALDVAPSGEALRINDCWTFIARYADNSVEELEFAPPHDTHHHVCRLAMVDAAGGEWVDPVVDDCRDPIEPGEVCCCTVVVEPGEDIQAAIDSLPDDFGGCVCLKPGVHQVTATLRIETPNVVLHGECRGVTVARIDDGPVLEIVGTADVDVHTIRFAHRAAENSGAGIIEIFGSTGISIHDCEMTAVRGTLTIGVLMADASNVTLRDNRIQGLVIGIAMPARCDRIRIEGNTLAMGGEGFIGQFGVTARAALGPVHVERNVIENALTGVSLNDDPTGAARGSLATGSRVVGNEITMALQSAAAGTPTTFFGVDSGAGDTLIHGNRIYMAGGARAGIRYSGVGGKITDNLVEVDLNADDEGENSAIFVGTEPGTTHLTRQITVTGNSMRDVTAGIVVRETSDTLIAGNEVDAVAGRALLTGIFLDGVVAPRVTDNSVRQAGGGVFCTGGRLLQLTGNAISDCAFGAATVLEIQPTVAMNSITNVAAFGIIAALTVAQTSFVENHVSNAGSVGNLPFALGGLLVLGEWHVEANEVINTGAPIDGATNPNPVFGILGTLILESRIDANIVTYSSPQLLPDGREDRALLIQSLLEFAINLANTSRRIGFPCQITNNKFIGKGLSALVEMRETALTDNLRIRFERVFFNHNYCLHSGPGNEASGNASVILEGFAGVVMGNQVKTENGLMPSVNMSNMAGTMVGNITTSGFIQDPNFPVPETDFNRQL